MTDHQATGWAAKKTRIVETDDGRFMPQIKTRWLWGWRFLGANADTSRVMGTYWLTEDDPARAATFASEPEARAFVKRFTVNVDLHWQRRAEAQERARQGVKIKRTIDSA